MNAFIRWAIDISLPVFMTAAIGLTARAILGRRSPARRTAWGIATVLAMAIMTTLPLWPSPSVEAELPKFNLGRQQIVETAYQPTTAAKIYLRPETYTLSIGQIISTVFFIGFAVLLLRGVLGWFGAHRLRRQGQPTDLEAPFPVRIHPKLKTPIAIDGPSPTIVLPEGALDWPADRLNAVIRHESSHLRRRDGLWLMFSQFLCAAQWPNPLVWLVDHKLRQDLEFLSDDEVILLGTSPATYAQSMLDLAAPRRLKRLTAASPFAKRSGLKARISAIVDSQRSREPMSKTTLALPIVAALGATAFVGLSFAQGNKTVANPTSWDPDVKSGKTVPASPSNGYVGILKDGRKVFIDQISMKTDKGVIAWRPDGTIIPTDKIEKVGYPKSLPPTCRVILLRAEKSKDNVEPMLSLGSGPYDGPNRPTSLGFMGGGLLKDRGDNFNRAVSFIDVPKEDGSISSFTMSINDSPWKNDAVYQKEAISFNAGKIDDIKIEIGPDPKDSIRKSWLQSNPGPVLKLTWTRLPQFAQDDVKVLADVKKGDDTISIVEPEGNYGGYGPGDAMLNRYYIPAKDPKEVTLIRFFSRNNFGVELLDIKLKPN